MGGERSIGDSRKRERDEKSIGVRWKGRKKKKKRRVKQGKPSRGRQCGRTRGHRLELCLDVIVEQ